MHKVQQANGNCSDRAQATNPDVPVDVPGVLVDDQAQVFGSRTAPLPSHPEAPIGPTKKLNRMDSSENLGLQITVVSASDLPPSDWTQKADPYCKCRIAGQEGWQFTTGIIYSDLNPVWNDTRFIHRYRSGDDLEFKVFDHDDWDNDDELGMVVLNASDFLPNGFDAELPLRLCQEVARHDVKSKLSVNVKVLSKLDTSSAGSAETKAQANSRDILSAPHAICLDGSIWDCGLFIGMRIGSRKMLMTIQELVLMLLVIINLIVQFIFVTYVQRITEGELAHYQEILAGVQSERILVGHHWNNLDHHTFETRAAQVCAKRFITPTMQEIDTINTYFGESSWESSRILSSVAVLIWIVFNVAELRRALEVLLAFYRLEPSKLKGEGHISVDASGFQFKRASRKSKILFTLFLFLPRLTVDSLLAFYGVKYLASTVVLSDLILNACALEIVANVDEFLFSGIVSAKVKEATLQTSICGMEYREPKNTVTLGQQITTLRSLRHLVQTKRLNFARRWLPSADTCVSLLSLIACISCVVLVNVLDLRQVSENMEMISAALCGPNNISNPLNWTWYSPDGYPFPFFSNMPMVSDANLSVSAQNLKTERRLFDIRLGFWSRNQTLVQLVRGEDHACKQPRYFDRMLFHPSCNTVPYTNLDSMVSFTEKDFLSHQDTCLDHDLHFAIYRDVCLEDNCELSDALLNKTSCHDWALAGYCCWFGQEDQDAKISDLQRELQITSPDWLRVVKSMCPRSCGMCPQDSEVLEALNIHQPVACPTREASLTDEAIYAYAYDAEARFNIVKERSIRAETLAQRNEERAESAEARLQRAEAQIESLSNLVANLSLKLEQLQR